MADPTDANLCKLYPGLAICKLTTVAPRGERRTVLHEVNGRTVEYEAISDGHGDWSADTSTIRPVGGPAPTATVDGEPRTADEIAVAKAALDYATAKWKVENGVTTDAAIVELETAYEALNQLKAKGAVLGQQLQQDLDKGAATIRQVRAQTGKTEAETETERGTNRRGAAEIDALAAATGRTRADIQKLDIETRTKLLELEQLELVGLPGLPRVEDLLADLVRLGIFDSDEAAGIFQSHVRNVADYQRTGLTLKERLGEGRSAAGERRADSAEERARQAETRAGRQQQIGVAENLLAREPAPIDLINQETQRQNLRADAFNTYLGNYLQHGVAPTREEGSRNFLDGLGELNKLIDKVTLATTPSATGTAAQGFLGNLLSPTAARAAYAQPGPPAVPAAELTDPLMAAAASEDEDTPVDPADYQAIMAERDPVRAINLSVESWQRAVSRSGKSPRSGTINRPQPVGAREVL